MLKPVPRNVSFSRSLRTAMICALLSLSFQGFGQLFTDDFDYGGSAGDLTTVSGGTWSSHSGTTAVGYQTSTLSLAGYPHAGMGGAATVSGSNSQDVNATYTNQTTGVVYASALINIASVSGSTYFFHLKDTGTNFRGRVFARDNGGNLEFGLSSNSGTGTFDSTAFSYNTTYLVVLKWNVDTGAADLFVLSSVPTSEPGTALISTTGTGGQVSSVAFRQSSGGPVAVIDGVRVGTTWNDSVPVELMNFSVE